MAMVFMMPAATQPAHAGTTTYSTNLTAGSPTYERANWNCTSLSGWAIVGYDFF